jgi:hypothetical protein
MDELRSAESLRTTALPVKDNAMSKKPKTQKKTAARQDPMKNGTKRLKEFVVPMQAVRAPFGPTGPGEAVRAGIMVYGSVLVGPNAPNTDFIVKAMLTPPVLFSVTRPRIIQLQARQSDNLDFGFPDQFGLMVLDTGVDFLKFRSRRLDNGAQPTGWGQNLSVDILCIDDGTEPPFGG